MVSHFAAEVAAQLHEAIACAVYLRSPDASGVVALLLRQGQRVHAEDDETYAERTGLRDSLSAQPLHALQDERLKAVLPHVAFLRVANPVELSRHLVAAEEQAGAARMHELRSATPEEYLKMTGLDERLDAAIEKSGLRGSSPPADVVEKIANALAGGSSSGAAPLPPTAESEPAARQTNQQRAAPAVEAPHRPAQQYPFAGQAPRPTPESKPASSFGWRASSWAGSVEGVPAAIAAALLGSASRADDLTTIRALAERLSSPDELVEHLRGTSFIEDLAGCLFPALEKLQSANCKAATASELYNKFMLEGDSPFLSYSGLDAFFGGLEKIIGPPSADVLEAMRTEHCKSVDSEIEFTTKNYELTTTSATEWRFVAEPQASDTWPVEENIKRALREETQGTASRASQDLLATGAKPRAVVPVAELEARMQTKNEQLEKLKEPLLIEEEIFGARLYTGPLFLKYNAVMRGLGTDVELLQKQMVQLCCSRQDEEGVLLEAKPFSEAKDKVNTYVTTLHVINSAIVKLSKLTTVSKVYRGVGGMKLPASFMEANDLGVRGGIEPAFMSTSLDRQVALEYAGGSDVGLVLEIQQGMVSRGADISFVSQYPHEKEVRSPCP